MIRWKESLIVSNSIITIISSLILIFSAIGSYLAYLKGIISPQLSFILLIFIAIFLIIIFIILIKRKFIFIPRSISDFKLLKKEIIYEYYPDGKTMKYTKK